VESRAKNSSGGQRAGSVASDGASSARVWASGLTLAVGRGGVRPLGWFAVMGGRSRFGSRGPGQGLTPRPPDVCGGGIVGRERNLAAGAGDVFR
jgi:hypothetical protein